MKSILSTISIFTSSSSTFITQLIAVWILGKDDVHALLVLGAFMPFGFVLSSLSDSLRSSALPISSSDTGDSESKIRSLLLISLATFLVLILLEMALAENLRNYISLPMIASLEFLDLLMYMTGIFCLVTFSSILTTVLFAKEKSILATIIILMSNVLNIVAVYIFVEQGFGVISLVYAALLSSTCSFVVATSVSREVRAVVFHFTIDWGELKNHCKYIGGIVVPIFSSYGLLVVWMFYLTHILLNFSDQTIAAFPLYIRVQNILIILAVSVGVAQAIQFNKKTAEFDYSLIRTDTRNYTIISFAYLAIPILCLYLFADNLAAFLVKDGLVADEIALYLRTVAPGLIVLSTYVGMTVYLEQTHRSKRAFYYNLIFIFAEIGVIEYLRPAYETSGELYNLLSIVFLCSSLFIIFEFLKTRHEFYIQQKMQGATL